MHAGRNHVHHLPDHRLIIVEAASAETLIVSLWYGQAGFWRIQAERSEQPVAEVYLHPRDYPVLAWLLEQITRHSALP
jgi:hypothetical protein